MLSVASGGGNWASGATVPPPKFHFALPKIKISESNIRKIEKMTFKKMKVLNVISKI